MELAYPLHALTLNHWTCPYDLKKDTGAATRLGSCVLLFMDHDLI